MRFKYCPNCGDKGSVEAKDKTTYYCTSCKTNYWNNPKPATSIIFIKDDKILFSKRGLEPDIGRYELPGGFLEYGESAEECCVREISEETGLVVSEDDLRLIGAYPSEYSEGISTLDILFIVTRWQGEPKADDDVAELEWKPISYIESDDFLRPYFGVIDKITEALR